MTHGSGDVALAGSSSGELDLDVLLRQPQTGGDTIDDASHALAVGLSVGVHAEQ
jgi:hypothetical protein